MKKLLLISMLSLAVAPVHADGGYASDTDSGYVHPLVARCPRDKSTSRGTVTILGAVNAGLIGVIANLLAENGNCTINTLCNTSTISVMQFTGLVGLAAGVAKCCLCSNTRSDDEVF